MTRTVPHINEIVSFAVMLLMVVALVAGEADATVQRAARDAAPSANLSQQHDTGAPLKMSMSSQLREPLLTISISVDAKPGRARMHE